MLSLPETCLDHCPLVLLIMLKPRMVSQTICNLKVNLFRNSSRSYRYLWGISRDSGNISGLTAPASLLLRQSFFGRLTSLLTPFPLDSFCCFLSQFLPGHWWSLADVLSTIWMGIQFSCGETLSTSSQPILHCPDKGRQVAAQDIVTLH